MTVALARMLRLGAAGLTWPDVGERLTLPPTTACRLWHQFASPKLQRQRSLMTRSHRFRGRPEDLARLIARGRSGDVWKLIGPEFYPNHQPDLAAAAAHNLFSRHATVDDKAARRAAMFRHNSNRTPGLSQRAEQRRRRSGLDRGGVLPEFARPWAGMGECFA